MPNDTATPPTVQHEHRSRLLQALALVLADKGYAEVTIADMVRQAGVSKRSFYEHFSSKEDCFLAMYRAVSASALRTLSDALPPDRPWQSQVEDAFFAYFSHLARSPRLLRALFVEVHHLGPSGMAVRREVMQQLADFMLLTVNGDPGHGRKPPPQVLSRTMAMAAVGAINELLLDAIERGTVDGLPQLAPNAAAVVQRLARA